MFAEIAAPPMNLLGPELVRDLVALIQRVEADDGVQVLVLTSADPAYFISHADLNRIAEYRAEAAKLTGEAVDRLFFRHLSASRVVTIAQIEGRVRAAGTELAERYGWINRALPAAELGEFVSSLAHRIAGFPAAGDAAVKARVNAITLAPVDEFRRDSDLFGAGVREPEGKQFHYAFTNTFSEEESAEVYERYHVAAPGGWVWGGVLANFTPGHQETWVDFHNDERAPLLFIAGGADHVMPAAVNKSNAEHYAKSKAHTDYKEFPGRSHYTLGQPGWEEVADFALNWCNEHTGRGLLSTARAGD